MCSRASEACTAYDGPKFEIMMSQLWFPGRLRLLKILWVFCWMAKKKRFSFSASFHQNCAIIDRNKMTYDDRILSRDWSGTNVGTGLSLWLWHIPVTSDTLVEGSLPHCSWMLHLTFQLCKSSKFDISRFLRMKHCGSKFLMRLHRELKLYSVHLQWNWIAKTFHNRKKIIRLWKETNRFVSRS